MNINWKQMAAFCVAGGLFALIANLLLKPDPIDYVNVALVPELAEELGADLATRLELAHIGNSALDGIQGPPGTPIQAGTAADKYGRTVLLEHGQRVFDVLSVPQRKQFYSMFRAREIVPITYRTESPPGGEGPALFSVEFGWQAVAASMHASLEKTAVQLANAWETIPSKSVAESLSDHRNDAVRKAAGHWLNEHTPRSAHKRPLAGPYAEDKWARHGRRIELAHRDLDRAFGDRTTRPSFEARSASMRREHDKRVAEMRTAHEKRVAKMRAEHDKRIAGSHESDRTR